MKTGKFFTSGDGPSLGLSDIHVSSFLTNLRVKGYAERTIRKKRSVAVSFAGWSIGKRLAVDRLNESHLASFVERSSQRTKARVNFEMAALQPFLKYLRAEAVIPTPALVIDASPAEDLTQRYIDHLRKERGLTEHSIRVYAPFITDFLNELLAKTGCVSPEALDARVIQEFILNRIHNRSSEYSRLLATALRSFFRFLYLHEETSIDFSLSVPTVRRWRQAEVPNFLSPDDVERVLSTTDRSTPRGRRDHAILLLLARLGIRAGEIVTLDLGDILWRTGEIAVRGKGRVLDRLPLLSDIGEALVLYITKDRGTCESRQVFLRMLAPRVGLAGPGAVGHIVRLALSRAGLRSSSRGAAHIFRHSLATRMIRQGASIAEISQVLRHRSQSTTQVYTKVHFETLREIARPWPAIEEVHHECHP
jgi:integrase/recombinase XerD